MPLYNDMRPRTLEDVLGNRTTVAAIEALFASCENEDIPNAFLLHGSSGTGKTTLARIIANLLGASRLCQYEINAAVTRGIDTIRELIRSASVAPLHGDAKVFILDEAHQLTPQAQNALLKSIEDAPNTTFWILCTTEADGIIPTIRNRCTTLLTSTLRPPEMKELLAQGAEVLCGDDGEAIDSGVIAAITKAAEGCPRRALVILERVAFIAPLEKQLEAVESELFDGVEKGVIDLCKFLASNKIDDWSRCSAIVSSLSDEPERIRIAVVNYFNHYILTARDDKRVEKGATIIMLLSAPLYSATARAVLTSRLFFICHELRKMRGENQ